MRFIPTRVHGLIDYLVGVFLIASPWLLGFAAGGAETWTPVILGAAAIVYSLFTDYEWGLVKSLGVPGHLALDTVSGVILAASPWLFGFAELVWWPHLILGLFEIAGALFTQTARGYRARPAR